MIVSKFEVSLSTLPKNVLVNIFSFLTLYEARHLKSVNKKFYAISKNLILAKQRVNTYFPYVDLSKSRYDEKTKA